MVAYKDWLFSSDKKMKEKYIDALNKSGVPLEYKTKKRLENLNFIAHPYFYNQYNTQFNESDPGIKKRELDFLALYKNTWSIGNKRKKGIEIGILLQLAVECKYSSDKDFIVFEPLENLGSPNFPFRLSGKYIFPEFIDHHFNIPTKIAKIAEVNFKKLNKKDDNFNDRITFRASEQLHSAIRHEFDKLKYERHNEYFNILKNMEIRKKFDELNKKGEIKRVEEPSRSYIPENEKDRFCREYYELFDFYRINHYFIDVMFPLLIIEDNRGVIKAKLDDKNEIIDFEDVGYGLFYYTPQPEEYHIVGNEKIEGLPIIICNLSYLDDCIGEIIKGMDSLKKDIEKRILKEPQIIVKEFMFGL